MARPRKEAPDLFWYSARRQWAVKLAGRRRLLGPDRLTAESKRLNLIEQWRAAPDAPPPTASTDLRPSVSPTVAEVLRAYAADVARRVTPVQAERVLTAIDFANRRYGSTPAAAFGTLALQSVRQDMAAARSKRKPYAPLSRTYVNHLAGCLQTAWLWAESRQMVPPHHGLTLQSVRALGEGQGGRETDPRQPVAAEVVAAALPHCGPVLGAMVRFQHLTGCRPQDVCGLTPGRVSRAADQALYPMPGLAVAAFTDQASGRLLWVYCPERHKNRKRGKPRIVVIGPDAQAVLAPYLDRPADQRCFTPAEHAAARHARMRAARETPVQPSQAARTERRAATPGGRKPGPRWTTQTYGQALARAVRRANRARTDNGLSLLPHFTAHQLRHEAATAARNRSDDHTAAAVLGDHPDQLRTYARVAMLKAGSYLAEHG